MIRFIMAAMLAGCGVGTTPETACEKPGAVVRSAPYPVSADATEQAAERRRAMMNAQAECAPLRVEECDDVLTPYDWRRIDFGCVP